MKTADEYLVSYGRCPYCDSDQIEGGSFDPDGDVVTQEVGCNDCEKTWHDYYKLMTYLDEDGNFVL